MYLPSYAKEENVETIEKFIQQHSFATLVTQEAGESVANHLPILFGHSEGRRVLSGHMARSNPQWQTFQSGGPVLVIFQGPHTYISPSFYVNPLNVPTWNYTAVHVYGKATAIHDSAKIEEILEQTVLKYESQMESPWKYDLPQEFREKLVQAIVGFEIIVDRYEAKFKLSQNREAADYDSVIRHLSKSDSPNVIELLKYMNSAPLRRT